MTSEAAGGRRQAGGRAAIGAFLLCAAGMALGCGHYDSPSPKVAPPPEGAKWADAQQPPRPTVEGGTVDVPEEAPVYRVAVVSLVGVAANPAAIAELDTSLGGENSSASFAAKLAELEASGAAKRTASTEARVTLGEKHATSSDYVLGGNRGSASFTASTADGEAVEVVLDFKSSEGDRPTRLDTKVTLSRDRPAKIVAWSLSADGGSAVYATARLE